MSEKWRIMVVDDDEDTRRLLAVALGTKYEVVEASNGLDALTKLEDVEPDFIILDVKMPLLDGYETCAAIRKNPKFRSVKVMFLSGMDDKEHIKKGYEAGADLYLKKPIDSERLVKNVELHFASSPPPRQKKKLTIEQIRRKELLSTQVTPPQADIETEPDVRIELVEESTPTKTPTTPGKPVEIYMKYERPRVMIIDDDPDIISLMRLTLEGKVETVWATDSIAAIERLARYEPDILLLDIMMPKLSGFQFLQTVRQNPLFKTMPIIVVSAKSSPKDRDYALRLGANFYLTKPFSPADLLKLVETCIQLPGFKVRRKRLSYEAVMQLEISKEETVAEVEEKKFYRRTEGEPKKSQRKISAKELENFIQSEMKDETNTES